MKILTAILFLAIMAFGAELKVDSKASFIGFEATKMLFVSVDGNFSQFRGTINVENEKVTAINGVIKVLSIDTDDAKRDDHLLSSDFFNAVKFDEITFISTNISGDEVTADVTIKNITKSLTFAMEQIKVTSEDVEIKLTAVVDRTEFDIDNNFMSMMIFDNIDVTATLIAK